MKRLSHLLTLWLPFLWSCSTTGPAVYGNTAGRLLAKTGARYTPAENPATGLYGYVNDLGLWVIQPKFDAAQHFSDCGLARVRIGNRYGAIDPLGQLVIAAVFSNGYTVDSAIRSIDKGRLPGIDLWMERDPATELYGYLDYYGRWAIAPHYFSAREFGSNGIAVVAVEKNRWGAIDRRGAIVVQPSFNNSYEAEAAVRRLSGR